MSLAELGTALRKGISQVELEALDNILCLRLVRVLARESDVPSLAEEASGLRRLVQHRDRSALEPWSGRWLAFADVVDAAAQTLLAKSPSDVLGLAHVADILLLVEHNPGLRQVEI